MLDRVEIDNNAAILLLLAALVSSDARARPCHSTYAVRSVRVYYVNVSTSLCMQPQSATERHARGAGGRISSTAKREARGAANDSAANYRATFSSRAAAAQQPSAKREVLGVARARSIQRIGGACSVHVEIARLIFGSSRMGRWIETSSKMSDGEKVV